MTTMNPSVCGSNERSKVAKDVESCLGRNTRKDVAPLHVNDRKWLTADLKAAKM